jgi:glycosyltransferase involved in cell wall biosynthesis
MSHPEGISIVLLTKNCAKSLQDCLDSVNEFIDRDSGDEIVVVDTGSSDNTPVVAEQCGARVFRHPELNSAGMLDLVKQYLPAQYQKCAEDAQFNDGFLADFAAARTLADTYTKNNLLLWLDSDDVLVGGPALRETAANFFKNHENTTLFLQYDYAFDPDGTCSTSLWRERFYRKGLFSWKGVCHESLIPNGGPLSQIPRVPPEEARVLHKHGRHHTFSDIRNYAILRHAFETSDWKDPRWDYYLGNACRGLGVWGESVRWYKRVLSRSGSRDDRFAAALYVGYIHLIQNRFWRAIDWFSQAVKIQPDEPRAHFAIARAYFLLERWSEVIFYTNIGRMCGRNDSSVAAVDPNQYDFYPGCFEAKAYQKLGQHDRAIAAAQEAVRLRPNMAEAQGLLQELQQDANHEAFKAAVGTVCRHAFNADAQEEIIRAIRPETRKVFPELQLESFVPNQKNTITFLTGPVPEPWDASSVASGIGGSEKMVILLGEEFARRGFRVDVYGSPTDGRAYKTQNGVCYKPFHAFNPKLERNILIVWRAWGFLDHPLKAKKIFMDLHDVQNPADYTPARLAKISGAFFKSNFHCSPVKDIIGDKAIITRNAIDTTQFDVDVARDSNKIIWASSCDRGVLRALRIFARIKQQNPAAHFHIFYGFTPLYLKRAAQVDYQYFPECGSARHMLDYMEEVHDVASQLGAVFHGRIGHKEIAREFKSSSILLYPTSFDEISCMSSMEAQMAGCFPVVGATGALPETCSKWGTLLDPTNESHFADIAAIAMKAPDAERVAMADYAKRTFNVQDLAASWLQHFGLLTP